MVITVVPVYNKRGEKKHCYTEDKEEEKEKGFRWKGEVVQMKRRMELDDKENS